MEHVYLDHAATTPCDPLVVEAMRPYFNEIFGNASSPHAFGRQARKATEDAREELSSFIGCQPSEIIFTSGATEANNHAIVGVARALRHKGKHLVISAIEHHSIIKAAENLSLDGYVISWAMPDEFGVITAKNIEALLRPDTILVAVGHANNEIGVLQDIASIGRITRPRGVYLLVDAVQSLGHIQVNVAEMQCDLLSLSAHKFNGPQGVGALYIRKGVLCEPLLVGGDQERARRATTLNVPGIVGLGVAITIARLRMKEEILLQTELRDLIINSISQRPGAVLNGHPVLRLPNNAHFSFDNTDGEQLVAALDMAGFACSVGSACTSGQLEPSHVLKAIGLSDQMALGSLRITVGRITTKESVKRFIEEITKILCRQK